MRTRLRRSRERSAAQAMLQTQAATPWQEVGLARQLSRKPRAGRAARPLVLLPLLAGVLVVYAYRDQLFGADLDLPVRIAHRRSR